MSERNIRTFLKIESFFLGSTNCLELFSKYVVISMLNELPYMYNVLHCRNGMHV